MFTKLPYDTLKDFAGVSRIANVPRILIVAPALGARSAKELIALAKAKPGQFNFSFQNAVCYLRLSASTQPRYLPLQPAHHFLHTALGHHFHHFLRLFELFEQAVDLLHGDTRADGNAALA